jgi:hypothetical protein
MADLRFQLAGNSFEVVHPGRWKHLPTGKQVETGYTRGEGRVRIYQGRSRTPTTAVTFLGGASDTASQVRDLLYPPADVFA